MSFLFFADFGLDFNERYMYGGPKDIDIAATKDKKENRRKREREKKNTMGFIFF